MSPTLWGGFVLIFPKVVDPLSTIRLRRYPLPRCRRSSCTLRRLWSGRHNMYGIERRASHPLGQTLFQRSLGTRFL